MQSISAEVIELIKQRLVDAIHPRLVYLYGSHAYGNPGPDSDLDLLIVVETPTSSTRAVAAEGYAALRGTKIPIELNVVTCDGFECRKQWFHSIERDAWKKGKLLYAA